MNNGGFPPIENIIKKDYKKITVEKKRFFSNVVNVTDIFNIKISDKIINMSYNNMTTIDSL